MDAFSFISLVHRLGCFPCLRGRPGGGWTRIWLFGGIALLLAVQIVEAQAAVQDNSSGKVMTRPCSMVPAAAASKPSKRTSRNKRKNSGETVSIPPTRCLEVLSAGLDIQEYLQTYIRDQKWQLDDEHVAEDAWTFYRNLGKDELLSATKSDANNLRVTWTSGKAFFQVRTAELAGGFTRVSISASFQGYGENLDHFAPPRESWPLNSNGTLEAQLLYALDTHLKSLH